ncbi:MAG: aminotransferase class I/II-fold pyridoxal phosphate-dependent enzyme [Kiritimatiellia bacterium]
MTTDSKSRRSFVSPSLQNIPRSGIRDFFDIVANRKDVISLGIGEPDFVTPWHVRVAAIQAIEKGATHYTANLGMPELRQAIAQYVAGAFHASYDWKTQILVAVGVSEALDLAIRAVLEPGDEVLYHEPCFVAYAPLIRMAHAVPVPVPTCAADGFRLQVSALEARVTPRSRVLLLNFPTNPTGATLRRSDVEDLAAFAIRHDLLVITDEVYSELTYEGERVSLASIPGMAERIIFLHGFSKAWAMTGFRLGFACAPADLIEAMMKIHQYCMMSAPTVSQVAGIEALRNGADDIVEMRESYRQRRNCICAALNEMGLACHVPEGAFYVFPSIQSTGLSSKDFAMRLIHEESVACVPGSAFGACGEGYLRCCYATDIKLIREAMRRMERFVKKVRG